MVFEEGLCHRCNLAVPSLRYCRPVYGTEFIQRYGWYVRQEFLASGLWPPPWVRRSSMNCLQELSDVELLGEFQRLQSIREAFPGFNPRFAKERRRFEIRFENKARAAFGFAAVGEAWVNETLLFRIVEQLLPRHEVIHHFWPEWLDGLELDIFVPDLNLALEYQGQQHFQAVDIWGGEESLSKQQARDRKKAERCKEVGVRLVKVNYSDPMTLEFVAELLSRAGVLGPNGRTQGKS